MYEPRNIKIKFGNSVVTLKDKNDRRTTPDGVEIYLQERPSDYRAWATVPDGTLEINKRNKPVILGCEWVDVDY